MLGFAIPLLVFCALEGAVGLSLLLPLPFSRPSIAICKVTTTQAGRSVIVTISVILVCLLLAPLYDILTFKDRPESTAGANAERRQSEATAHLGAILTGYDLLAMFVVRKLGLSLGKLDDVTSETKSVHEIKAEVNVFAAQTDPQTVTQ
ncbi:hypothetical protein ABBQ32_011741 [Trebouxia sp. C0010 RCD-2024]